MQSEITIPVIGNDWDEILKEEWNKPYMQKLLWYINFWYGRGEEIYPPKDDIFNALKSCSFDDTKVVIVGQDPYINPGQAHGYAFSVPPGIDPPPSLVNIFKELESEIGCFIPDNGCLIPWANQGVLLLNSILTVERGRSNSHAKIGWEIFTDKIIELLNQKAQSIVFMLWGNYAKKKGEKIDETSHLVLKAAHPSPLAGGAFFGCDHFRKANEFLYEIYPTTIDWQISNIKEES